MGFDGDKLAYEHIYWDQASVLVQIGTLDPAHVPTSGVEQADLTVSTRRPHRLSSTITNDVGGLPGTSLTVLTCLVAAGSPPTPPG